MQLKHYERKIYRNNTIADVTCQINFPTILKINSPDTISKFQDKIRKEYQIYKVEARIFPGYIQGDNAFVQPAIVNEHRFSNENSDWVVAISQDYITFSNTKYERFETFIEKFTAVIETFITEFSPSEFIRIGLRYRNIICRSIIGAVDVKWHELIPCNIVPELHDEWFRNKVKYFDKKIFLEENEEKINTSYTLLQASGKIRNVPFDNEDIYIVDIDCFTEKKHEPVSDIITLANFNQYAGSIFRSSITERLDSIMRPE